MDVLRSKTPEMVRKEIYIYLLAYNLKSTLMWEAGKAYGVLSLRLSMHRTRQHLNNFIPQLLASSGNKRRKIYRTLLAMIVHKRSSRASGTQWAESQKTPSIKLILEMQQPRYVLRQQRANPWLNWSARSSSLVPFVSGSLVRFQFRGKSGVQHSLELNDRRIARIVKQCRDLPGYELFQYFDENGSRQTISSEDVNAYTNWVWAWHKWIEESSFLNPCYDKRLDDKVPSGNRCNDGLI